VGIDFGTTFSGIAWAQTKRIDHREVITTWPISETMLEGESSSKVPTTLRYTGGRTQWGFSIDPFTPHHEVIDWFKL
jgi:molecular chaperone DnaK (HSP70)